jgi:hypothetical protein
MTQVPLLGWRNALCNPQANSFFDQFGSVIGWSAGSRANVLVKCSFLWCWLPPKYQQEAIPLGQVWLSPTSKNLA